MKAINVERKKLDNISWLREYLLKIVPDDDVVTHPDWIRYYAELPTVNDDTYLLRETTSVDLAISDKTSADFTAILQAKIYQIGDDIVTYILPHPLNQRLDFPSTVDKIKQIYEEYNEHHSSFEIYVEETSYQKSIVQHLESMEISVQGVSVNGIDKRSRLSFTAPKIKNGSILFPKEGADALINQIVGFGVEAHDDLADAFTMLVQETARDQPYKHIPFIIENRMFDFDNDPYKPRYDEETDSYVFGN